MENLTYQKVRNGYDLTWLDIRLEVRRLRRKDDDWRCHLLVGQVVGDGVDLIWTGNHLLEGPRSRSTLAAELALSANHIDWRQLLQQLTFRITEAERQGEPILNMAEYPEPEGLNYLLQDWVLEGKPSALFGLGGTGKTWMGLDIVYCLASGLDYIGWRTPHPVPTAIFDYENDPDTTRLRLAKIAKGHNEAMPAILYRQLSIPMPDMEERIAQDIDEHGIKFALLDSFGLASGGGQSKDEVIIPVYATLRRLGIATLIIDHESKASNGEYAIGTIYKHNLSRITWQVEATKEDTEKGDLYLRASNRKNNEGPRHRPIGIHMMFGPSAMAAKCIDVADLPSDLVAMLPLATRIMAALRMGNMDTNEIKEAVGDDGAAVNTRLKEMEKAGKIVQLYPSGGKGKPAEWGLPSERRDFE